MNLLLLQLVAILGSLPLRIFIFREKQRPSDRYRQRDCQSQDLLIDNLFCKIEILSPQTTKLKGRVSEVESNAWRSLQLGTLFQENDKSKLLRLLVCLAQVRGRTRALPFLFVSLLTLTTLLTIAVLKLILSLMFVIQLI